jgi:hypothetical protein
MPTGDPLVDPRMRAHRPGPTMDIWEMWRRKEVTVDETGDAWGGRRPNDWIRCPTSHGGRGVGTGAAVRGRFDVDRGLAMTTHDGHGRELDARLGRANEQIEHLREATDRSGNVVQFRMARYLESLHELVVDLNERSRQMPPADTYERRTFERDLGSLEDLIAVTFAQFASATAEEQGDAHQEMRADRRLLDVEAEAAKSWWRRMFRRGAGSTGEGGGARGTKI